MIAALLMAPLAISAVWPNAVAAAGPTAPAAGLGVSWQAAALIALCYYLSQSAWLAGLGFWTLYRPLVGGALVGLILGDPVLGTQTGALINLAYLGFLATGGTLPSDISLAGYLGTALVIAGGLDDATALAMTVPVGLLGYLIYQFRMTVSVVFVHWADRRAALGDATGVAWINALPAQLLLLPLCVVPCFLGVYLGPELVAQGLERIPAGLLSALGTVGSLLPALGIATSLNVLWYGTNRAFFVIGFVLSALWAPPVLAVAGMVGAVAYLYQAPRDAAPRTDATTLEAVDAAPPHLTRRDLLRPWLNWLFFSHGCYNYENWQGLGFTHSLIPILRKLYSGQELAQALQRHLVYYNSEPNLGAVVNGVVIAMEESRANLPPESRNQVSAAAINGVKTSLMGPLSGLGDSLLQGTIAPALISVGIALAREGNLLGPMLYTIAMAAIIWIGTWLAFSKGYHLGRRGIARLLAGPGLQHITSGVQATGAAVLGALAATYVNLYTPLSLRVGDVRLSLQTDLLDPLLPRILPLGVVLLYLWLLRRRKRPLWLVLGTFVIGSAASLLGLL